MAEIEKLRKRREERAVRKAQREEEAEARARARAQMDLPEPEREEEEDRSMLIAVVKEQQRRIQEAMGMCGTNTIGLTMIMTTHLQSL